MCQFARAQFAIEGQPLGVQLRGQFREALGQGPTFQLLEGRRLLVGRDEFGAQMAMLLAVVHIDFGRPGTQWPFFSVEGQ